MSSKQAGLIGAMKWLVPRYPEQGDKLFKLGSVLTDPYNLESSLTQYTNVAEVPDEDIRDQSNAIRNAIHNFSSQNRSVSASLEAPLSSILDGRFGLEAGSGSTSDIDIAAINITAKAFNPSPDYMNKVLELPEVVERVRSTRFSQSLYIVIGVATAEGLSVTETKDKTSKAGIVASITVPPAGVGGGINASYEKTKGSHSVLSAQNRLNFAYRAREFEYKRWRRTLNEVGDVTAGALMGKGDEEDYPEDGNWDSAKAEFVFLEDSDIDWKEGNDSDSDDLE